jgi:SAM-dependent methyltransferase
LFAYQKNINIIGTGCSSWCELVTLDWAEKCSRGFDEAPCMASITPECVMEAANKLIGERKNYTSSTVECPKREGAIVDFIAANCTNGNATVVDILNANGWDLARQLRANFSNVTMFRLDHRFDSFSSAKDLGLGLEYGCIYNISMGDDSCDAVVWQNGDPTVNLEYALTELFRILKPKGLLVLSGITSDGAAMKKFGLGEILSGVNAFTKETVDD